MTVCDSDDIVDLKNHWQSAYFISGSDGRYVAVRRDGKGTLTASSVAELWRMIREDYRKDPVPRDL
jgi:hypothetical protein